MFNRHTKSRNEASLFARQGFSFSRSKESPNSDLELRAQDAAAAGEAA